jgi:hypothetical protein
MVWESIVFVGFIIAIPIIVAGILGGRGKKKAKTRSEAMKGKEA